MSKGANSLINKAEVVAKGLRKTAGELNEYGIDLARVEKLEAEIERLRATDAETEAQLVILNEKRAINAEARTELYDHLQALKHIVKNNFDKTQWSHFGLEDKQ